jgi:hypothetical protein
VFDRLRENLVGGRRRRGCRSASGGSGPWAWEELSVRPVGPVAAFFYADFHLADRFGPFPEAGDGHRGGTLV